MDNLSLVLICTTEHCKYSLVKDKIDMSVNKAAFIILLKPCISVEFVLLNWKTRLF